MAADNSWEVVTKSKKQKNLEKKVEVFTEQKRIAAQLPKLDEILPSQQYRNFLAGKSAAAGKDNPSPAKSLPAKSKSPKKSVKASGNAGKEQESSKKLTQTQQKAAVKPKSLESVLRNLSPDDFGAQLEQLKLSYPGSELLWLKGIASYLNSNLPFDCDAIFSGKSSNYPSNLASQPLKNVVVNFLDSVGEANLAYFYHTLLISMAMELSKNMPIVGYKFLLQLIGQNWPQICSNNMAKTALLRNSYQNRSSICLSILWAVGQGGYQQLMEGIKVWQNLMLPNLELKSYSKFITEYIEKVLNVAVNQSLSLNQSEFFAVYNVLKSNYSGIPREQQACLTRSAEIFLQKYIASSSKHASIFLTLFRDIDDSNKNHIELAGCIGCLIRGGDDCFKVWKMNYKKQLVPSILLLKQLEIECDSSATPVMISKSFSNFLLEAKELNTELDLAKRRDPNLDELIAVIASVQEKADQQKKKQSVEHKKKCGCCKWVLGSIFLVALIGGVLAYDTQVNGKGVFAKSATGKALQNAGLLPYVEKGWYTTMSAGARGYKWAEQHVPPYAKPAGKLACDLFKLARNTACNTFSAVRDLVSAKLPVAAKFLEQYLPGLPKKIENTSVLVKNAAVDVYGKTVVFFKSQVLVGRFSPENLSKALNETQNVALEYFNLFHKKVDAYAKLK